jgi:spore germination protein KA
MINYNKNLSNNINTELDSTQQNNFAANKKVYTKEEMQNIKVSYSLMENANRVNEILGNNTDVVSKLITLGKVEPKSAIIFYIDNLVDPQKIDIDIIRPLVLDTYNSGLKTSSEIITQLQEGNLITRGETTFVTNFNTLINGILLGSAVLIIDGVNNAFVLSVRGYEYRQISESTVETSVKGPRDSFIEVLSVNISLIRRRLHTPNLVFETMELGTVGKNNICITYIKGICEDELVEEVRRRLNKIKIDEVMESNYIEELIEDNPNSIFPQVRDTERPDVAVAALLEGRIAIMVDNTPVAIIVPGEFFSLMQAAEDYYNRYYFSSFIRFIRYFAFAISIYLPALYIAVSTYHQEMIPTGLLISIIAARSEVPFPVSIEAFAMIITFEILHEAGIRLPRPIGQAVSIVGALVIGQAAVQAKIVSPLMVIVVALTAIAKFSVAQYNVTLPIRLLRLTFMLLASIQGMFGIMVGTLFLMFHLFSLESFGKPYMAPLSPLRTTDLKDTAVRAPWWAMVRRPAYSTVNSKRMADKQNLNYKGKRGGQQ